MGNTPSEPEPGPGPEPESEPPAEPVDEEVEKDTWYKWPANLFVELRDYAEVSSLIYSFAYLLNAARKASNERIMSELDALRQAVDEDSAILVRKFTPKQIYELLQEHEEFLTNNKDFPADPKTMMQSVQNLMARVPDNMPDALTLFDYDDVFQCSELVYAIGKDDVNKRVSIIFRGTENQFAFSSNWMSNLDIRKRKVPVPASIRGYVEFENVWIHNGFYGYVFQKTKTQKDAEATTKYCQVLDALRETLKDLKGYKVYVSGHSLGAALSTVFGFLLTAEADLPKPISVVNFASPRVGDGNFLQACHALQQHRLLRIVRMVNDNDLVAVSPTFNFWHVGFQVRVFRDPKDSAPQVTYPKLDDVWRNKFSRAWDNSWFTSVDASFDHSIADYQNRVMTNQVTLASLALDELYCDSNLTGFPELVVHSDAPK